MRSFFLLAIAGIFLASAVSATTETIELQTVDNEQQFEELHYDRDMQRRKEWDLFGVLLMMIHNDCGPHGRVGLLDCHMLELCDGGFMGACDALCEKKDHPHHESYSEFCDMSTQQNQYNVNTAQTDEYNGNSSPGNFVGSGNYSAAFSAWMVAAVASIVMALVAVHIGQRREEVVGNPQSLLGVNVHGSVGRRAQVVSGLMDGVLGGDTDAKQVELSEYQLEPARTSSYESAIV